MYSGWTQIGYKDRHGDTDRKEEGTWDGQRRDGGTSSTLRIKEQEKRLTLNERDDDDKVLCISYSLRDNVKKIW
jgi:hypothetical protein